MEAVRQTTASCSLEKILEAAEGQPVILVQDEYNRDVVMGAFETDAHMPEVSLFIVVLGLQGANSGERLLPNLVAASQAQQCEAVIAERFNEEIIRRACDIPEEAEVCALLGFSVTEIGQTASLPENVYVERYGARSLEEAERPSKAGGPMQSSLKCCGE